jgi:hypothetical protein
MQKIELEFDIHKGYSDVVLKGRKITKDDYLDLPIIQWAVKNIGPILTANPGEILHGQGWEIYADWQSYLTRLDNKPRVVLRLAEPVDDRLITDFWMRFQ